MKSYLFYAIGEILLVMIGIILALQVNNWNQNRMAFDKEKIVLLELKEDLESNIEIFQGNIKWEEDRIKGSEKILNHIDSGKDWNDTLGLELAYLRHFEEFFIMSAAYQSLKSNGFDLISSDKLRRSIIKLYDITYEREGSRTEIIGQGGMQTRELYYAKYTTWDPVKKIILLTNPESMDKNNELYNSISLRLQFKNYVIRFNHICLDETRNLIEEIDSILKSA
jgi:hypothetical protein